MHIVVCAKAVPSTTEVRMDPVTHTIVRDGRQAVINPFDTAALELALQVRDGAFETDGRCARSVAGGADAACGGLRPLSDEAPCADATADTAPADRSAAPVTVSVLSMGIPATEALLRDAISRGADEGVLLSDRAFAGADTLATTYALACGLAHMPAADLILCGKMAVDGDTAQIGPEIAGALGVPCVTDVRELVAVGARRVRAVRGADNGTEVVDVPLPAVLTVAKEAADLRMPSIAGVRRGACARVRVLGAEDVGADPARAGLAGSPTQVVRSFVPQRADEAVRVEGTVSEQAAQVADLIEGMAL